MCFFIVYFPLTVSLLIQAVFLLLRGVGQAKEAAISTELLTFYEIAKTPLIFSLLWFKIDLALGDKEC